MLKPAIDRIFETAKEQGEVLEDAQCSSQYCSGTCLICGARRRARSIEADASSVMQTINTLALTLQKIASHELCTGEQAAVDCLKQCVLDAKQALKDTSLDIQS